MKENKLIKVIFEYQDGTRKYIEGVELERWEKFNDGVAILAHTHGCNPKWEEVLWKTEGKDIKY